MLFCVQRRLRSSRSPLGVQWLLVYVRVWRLFTTTIWIRTEMKLALRLQVNERVPTGLKHLRCFLVLSSILIVVYMKRIVLYMKK